LNDSKEEEVFGWTIPTEFPLPSLLHGTYERCWTNKQADRPERKTALVARELARYSIDTAALSETRLADQG